MNIGAIYNNSFKGGFRLKNVSAETRTLIDKNIGRGKQIFDNFQKQGDVFLVTRDNKDYIIAKFIRDNNLEFEYYPTINTSLRLDCEVHETLSYFLEKCTSFTSDINKLLMETKSRINQIKTAMPSKRPVMNIELIMKTLDKLLINVENPKISKKHNLFEVYDKSRNRKINISPISRDGYYYVFVENNESDAELTKYRITSDCENVKKYNTMSEIREFYTELKKVIKENK